MLRNEAMDEYGKAQKLGQKDYREKMLHGQSPFLPVLDDILKNVQVENQLPLGLVEIPIKLVVGTKTAGRTAAFASNFMPLLDLKSEFGSKWSPFAWPTWTRASVTPSAALSTWAASMCRRATSASAC